MRVTIEKAIIAYPTLDKPESFNGGDPTFSALFIIPKTDPQVQKIEAAIEQVAKEKWGDKAEATLKILRSKIATPLKCGSLKNYNYFGETKWFIPARTPAKRPPKVVDGLNHPIQNIEHGSIVNVAVDLWVQTDTASTRINAALRGVQFIKAPERDVSSEPNMFSVLEGCDAPDFSQCA